MVTNASEAQGRERVVVDVVVGGVVLVMVAVVIDVVAGGGDGDVAVAVVVAVVLVVAVPVVVVLALVVTAVFGGSFGGVDVLGSADGVAAVNGVMT